MRGIKTTLFSNIKGDVFGGLTSGIVALPLALAFGVSSGLGPSAGLYGAIFLSFIAAFLGGTNTQISGPTAPMTAVSMVVIASIIAVHNGEVVEALPCILAVFLLAGLFQILLGVLGFGRYIKYIPYPVVSGFMTAIGVIILITQILPSVGYYPKEDIQYVNNFKPQAEEIMLENILKKEAGEGVLVIDDFKQTIDKAQNLTNEEIDKESQTLAAKESSGVIGALKTLPIALRNIKWLELILSISTIFIIYCFKKITTKIPSTLAALVLVSGIAIVFNLNYIPIEKIPSGFPVFHYEIFSNFQITSVTPYIFTALTLAFLGAIDSLLTSVVADNMTKTKHLPNKELIGQGIGNSVAALFGGLPGAGATIRTVVNINSGAKTKLSGMVAGIVLLFVLMVLGPIASKIPAAVLAGILITVGIGVMDYKGLKAIPSLPRDMKIGPLKLSSDVLIMIVVLLLSTFWNLVYAVGIGLVIASLLFMKKMGDLTANNSKILSLLEEKKWKDELDVPNHLKEEVYIKYINGPLFFGSTTDFQLMISQIPDTATTVVIRMDKMSYLDQSGLYAIEDALIELYKRNIVVLLVNIHKQPIYMMERIGIIPEFIKKDHIFKNFGDCLVWIKENVEDII